MPPTASCLPADANRVLISINPKAGARSSQTCVDHLVQLLQNNGMQVDVFTELDAVACEANRWHAEGRLRALVGVGGDGTAAELVNRTQEGVPITMLPAGNENLLARHLGLGSDPEACCRTIAAGNVVHMDAGLANKRLFLLMASCGFDAEVVHRLHRERVGHIRSWSYGKPIIESIRSYDYPELRIQWDGEAAGTAEVHWAFVFNLPLYGGGFEIDPEAEDSDGLLDVCTFRRGGLVSGLGYAAAILLHQHHRLTDFAQRRVRRLRITSEAKAPYQLDGDPGGFVPLEIETLPGRLTLVAPRSRIAD